MECRREGRKGKDDGEKEVRGRDGDDGGKEEKERTESKKACRRRKKQDNMEERKKRRKGGFRHLRPHHFVPFMSIMLAHSARVGLFACWFVGCLLACLLVYWLLACLLVCLLVCLLLACLLACWFVGWLLACLLVGWLVGFACLFFAPHLTGAARGPGLELKQNEWQTLHSALLQEKSIL